MAGGGLGSQIGFAPETTYGTAVTPTTFLEARSVGLEAQVEHMMSEGLRSGLRVMRSDRYVVNRKGVTGDIELDITTNNLARWLIHSMGDSRATSTIKSAVGSVYTYTMQLGDPASLSALTIQTGIEDNAGTVRRMDATGCYITEFSLSNEIDGIVAGSFSIDGRDYAPSASAATSATYATGTEPLAFTQGAFTIGGTAVPIRSYELSVTHGYDVERYQINSTSLKSRPIVNALDEITATIEMEFNGAAAGATWATDDLVTKYRAGTTLSNVQIIWTGATAISGGSFPTLTALIPSALITSCTPTIEGPEIINLSMEIMALDNGSNQPLSLTYVSSENLT